MGLGFHCYSKASLGRRVLAKEEFRFKLLPFTSGLLSPSFLPLTSSLPPFPSPSTAGLKYRTVMTRPSKRGIFLRQVFKLGGRLPKRNADFNTLGGQLLSNA